METTLVAKVQAFIVAHPLASVAFSSLGGAAFWHAALVWLQTNSLTIVDALTKNFKARQRLAAKKLGFTDAQILEAEQKEAQATLLLAQRAAADLATPDAAPAVKPDVKA